MRILVLDTIHGGRVIGDALARAGHVVDMVDVYRGTTPHAAKTAVNRQYDQIIAPVHLDPMHPLIHGRTGSVLLSHHDAVRNLLGSDLPAPMIEITGAQGKTTTACALAHVLPGTGVLHTSMGTFLYPERTVIWKKSITPASVLEAAHYAKKINGWLVAEESLGVTGAGNLAIITSSGDYPIAAGKKRALATKLASAQHSRSLLLADGISAELHRGAIHLDDVAVCHGRDCRITLGETIVTFSNPLLELAGYRTPLLLAGVAAAMLGIDPAPLESFSALPGRMSVQGINGINVIDNANSGTNVMTTLEAARYARSITGIPDLTLVIGTIHGDGAVCEGFPPDQIADAIKKVQPARVILVGRKEIAERDTQTVAGYPVSAVCNTLEEARISALENTPKGSIVLAVKTWR